MTLDDINNHHLTPTPEQEANMQKLADIMTQLEAAFGSCFVVTSGLRSFELQQKINPSVKNSSHLMGQAVDVNDPDGSIWVWLMGNFPLLENLGLYLEDKSYTRRWVHLQFRVPNSRSRVFIP